MSSNVLERSLMNADNEPYVKQIDGHECVLLEVYETESSQTSWVRRDEIRATLAAAGWQLAPPGSRVYGPDDEVVPMIKVGEIWLARPSTGWVEKYDENKHRLVCGGDDD